MWHFWLSCSLHGAHDLASLILTNTDSEVILHLWTEAHDHWTSLNKITPNHPAIQKDWDSINLERIVSEELQLPSSRDIARFKALQQPESGGWLQLIPSNNIGTQMNDQDQDNYYSKHNCVCGSLVDENGAHGLSCPKAKGTFPRHLKLNHIIYRALTSVHHSCQLEPLGLSHDDGKRPDGVTLSPWSRGKRLVWDATCVDTLAQSYLQSTIQKAGDPVIHRLNWKNVDRGIWRYESQEILMRQNLVGHSTRECIKHSWNINY